MKKVKLILAALAFFSLSAFSSGSESAMAKQNLKKQIFQKLDYATHDVEGTVHVFFSINEDNSVNLHNIIAETDELEDFVRKCMEDCHLITEEYMKGRVFEIELNFLLL